MLKVGLLGAGRIAGVHASAISSHPGSTLEAVSDINADAAAKLAAQYGAEARTTEAILADPAIDAVLIATSTDTHSDLIERATGAGKAVLWALLHKLGDGRASPFPGQTYPATSVTGVPSAVKLFRTATRTWNSAT
jgi:predicted dinucleotide-utilizing enzyme